MHLLDLIMRDEMVGCYPYCIGLNYDRKITINQQQWEKEDINVIAKLILGDLKKLGIPAKIVDKLYVFSRKENMLALRVGIKMKRGEYLYHSNYHVIVKREDGYWYSKFRNLPPERLPLNIDLESWDWQNSDKNFKRKYFNSKIIYIAFTRP